ncbi:transmembrane matrix receptor MUP-4-like [Ostrea edulis]|uniref:transmembrane matrix receptor MUP-4-like n=1 Tax=Ostrea edulis TaxID=37623 RepID=UPI0024AF8547|nr:transmembrane matrix receptor MUP-4-like [Ostrea edulis]
MVVCRSLFISTLVYAFLMTCHSKIPTTGCRPLDVVFLVDSSGSETNYSFNAQIEFMKEIVNSSASYNNNTKFGAVSFSNDARLEFKLNSSEQDIIRAISNISHIGKFTHLEEGFNFVIDVMFTKNGGDRPQADNVLLVLTDGIFHPENTTEPVEELLGKGVEIIPVLFTDEVTDKLASNANSITHTNTTYTKDTFDPKELFCKGVSMLPTAPPRSTIASATTDRGCRDNISICPRYGADMCIRFKSWAMVQCRCFCKFDQDSGRLPLTIPTYSTKI